MSEREIALREYISKLDAEQGGGPAPGLYPEVNSMLGSGSGGKPLTIKEHTNENERLEAGA